MAGADCLHGFFSPCPGASVDGFVIMLSQKIPRWILLGGALLAGGAGCINVVGFLGAQHQAISHMSGTVSNLGLELARGDRFGARHAGVTLASFFAGCVLSGVIIRRSTLRAGRRYGVALMGEAILLVLAAYFLRHDAITGDYLAAMACGLQNAMATSYSGAIIRTTHMTGIVTDLGIALGLLARGEPIDRRRSGLYLLLLFAFFTGGLVGAAGFARFGNDTLLGPAAVAGIAGISYTGFRQYRRSPTRNANA